MKYFKLFEKFFREETSSEDYFLIDIKNLEKTYEYFHISKKFLHNDETYQNFTFTVKRPKDPYLDTDGNVIEDDFTKRISLAKTIKECIGGMYTNGNEELYVYAIDLKNNKSDDIDTINLKSVMNKCPLLNGKYNTDFTLKEWLLSLDEENIEELQYLYLKGLIKDGEAKEVDYIHSEISVEDFICAPSDLPEKFRKLFYACVPDADENNEFWSINNLTMDYVGELIPLKFGYKKLFYDMDGIEDIPNVIKNLNQ